LTSCHELNLKLLVYYIIVIVLLFTYNVSYHVMVRLQEHIPQPCWCHCDMFIQGLIIVFDCSGCFSLHKSDGEMTFMFTHEEYADVHLMCRFCNGNGRTAVVQHQQCFLFV